MGITDQRNRLRHRRRPGRQGARSRRCRPAGPPAAASPPPCSTCPIDYDSLAKAGSIMGSGGMIVMDENTCMVDVAKYFMNFLKDESCGKCFTCRKGTQRMYEILDDITKGHGTLEHLDLLEELALVVKDTTHVRSRPDGRQPGADHAALFPRRVRAAHRSTSGATPSSARPGRRALPVGLPARHRGLALRGAHRHGASTKQAYQVIREANPFPSVCARVCDHPCEERCQLGTSGGEAGRDPRAQAVHHRPRRPCRSTSRRGPHRAAMARRPGWRWSAPARPD